MNSFPPNTFCDFNIVTGGLFCWLSWVTLILSGSILAGARKKLFKRLFMLGRPPPLQSGAEQGLEYKKKNLCI